ncbi:hypothetical protein L1887_34495 [Cichorium endivia]|nr:hypothetical protein L1887_34495 [Cichorium endivia]
MYYCFVSSNTNFLSFVASQASGTDYGDLNAPPCQSEADCKGYCAYYYYCNHATNRCSCLNTENRHLDRIES